jgi:hypothetical protein
MSVDETEICRIPLEPSWIKTARSKLEHGTCIPVCTKNPKAERNGNLQERETPSSMAVPTLTPTFEGRPVDWQSSNALIGPSREHPLLSTLCEMGIAENS